MQQEVSVLRNVLARLAVAGMSLAVIALGGLAVWSTSVAQHSATGLTRVGVQTSGQLQAVQALYVIRVTVKGFEDGITPEGMARLRAAQALLPVGLERMASGDSPEVVRVARQAQPLARQLNPAIERYLTDPTGELLCKCAEADKSSEDAMKAISVQLDQLLNDSEADPARSLSGKLAQATGAGHAAYRAAFVLIPFGLGGVLACGWLLRMYRRRSEATMRAALDAHAHEARTDQLTGLPNRRALMEQIDRRVDAGETFSIVLADLNGFKHYNDTFGHPAGDALLRRLGQKLADAADGRAFAGRLGGDEFCVLATGIPSDKLQTLVQTALTEVGEGFHISAECGIAVLPTESAGSTSALGLADARLYEAKGQRGQHRVSMPPVTMSFPVDSTFPILGDHLDRVTDLAVSCARALRLSPDQVQTIELAAQLHDIGKAAIPTAILAKTGALTDEEQQFIRRHSVIGERLISRMDILEPVATIVRATRERWDGSGYPDQLRGEDIPVGARIIAAADAFCAMTSHRPHSAARSAAEARAELSRCSGTQFDPSVVAAIADRVRPGDGDRSVGRRRALAVN